MLRYYITFCAVNYQTGALVLSLMLSSHHVALAVYVLGA